MSFLLAEFDGIRDIPNEEATREDDNGLRQKRCPVQRILPKRLRERCIDSKDRLQVWTIHTDICDAFDLGCVVDGTDESETQSSVKCIVCLEVLTAS